MEIIEIKGVKREEKIKEVMHSLQLLRDAGSIIVRQMQPTSEEILDDCVEYLEKMFEAESLCRSLILEVSEAIGLLTAFDIADEYLSFTEGLPSR